MRVVIRFDTPDANEHYVQSAIDRMLADLTAKNAETNIAPDGSGVTIIAVHPDGGMSVSRDLPEALTNEVLMGLREELLLEADEVDIIDPSETSTEE